LKIILIIKKKKVEKEKVVLTVNQASLETFMRHFEWNTAKYKTSVSSREIVDAISQEITQLDEELRGTQSEYMSVGHSIDAFERSKTGNLQVRDLSECVKENDIVESEHLTTIFVVVPKHSERDFDNVYDSLNDFVVPRSSRVITQDGDSVLRSIVLFKHVVDKVKSDLMKRKWAVREYSYRPGEAEERSGRIEEQRERRKQLKGDLTRWCKINFSEAFSAWVHLKAIRIFVESVLRFGLPRDYTFLIIEPDLKKEKTLRKALDESFKSLASVHMQGDTGDVVIAGTQERFYPYVFQEVDL